MESSTVLAFRIFVMLSCLIVVPMAAIFGSAFPDVVKSVLVDRLVAWGTGKPSETAKTAAVGGFGEVTPGGNSPQPGANNWEAPRWGAQGAAATAGQSQGAYPAPLGVIPAGAAVVNPSTGNQSASFAAPADPLRGSPGNYPVQRGTSEPPYGHPVAENGPGASQFGQQARPPAVAANDGMVSRAAQPLEQPERFTAMERRLREQGATYYLLETWGNEGELYRFHCKMAIGNNPNYTRHFEATDRDALKAMAQVLERVEAWRAGRLQ
ncbi:MAG: hypothetical protein HY288_13395 [Planctomycetia bacterium]|nr:hypothetical protein [Planctomycetia bacterium]